jgi:hypothetical protein
VAAGRGRFDPAFRRAAHGIGLAAAPTFALMACLAGFLGGGSMNMSCPVAQGALPLDGMVLMYGWMGVFHLGPWLRLFARRRWRDRHPEPETRTAPDSFRTG